MSLKLVEKEAAGHGSTDRVKKLNIQARSAPLTISLVRARAYTEVYKTTESLPPILRRAMATSKALDTTTPYILDGELVVGSESSALRAYQIHPELESNWIMMEGGLAAMSTRTVQTIHSTPEQIKEFDAEICPYWADKTIIAKLFASAPGDLIEKCYGAGFVEGMFMAGILGTHGNPDWDYIMANGLNGIKKTAQEKLAAWDIMNAEDLGKNHFYQAVIMEMEAIERFARTYADYAAKLADQEKDPQRKVELEQISEICSRVPHEAPRSFREAIQAFWFVLCAWHLEGNTGTSLSRFDQYMYPFYKKDIEAGILTREEAQEILECLWIKLSALPGIADSVTASFLDGAALFLNMQIGGVDTYGNDATNELSYLIIDALIAGAGVGVARIGQYGPDFAQRCLLSHADPHRSRLDLIAGEDRNRFGGHGTYDQPHVKAGGLRRLDPRVDRREPKSLRDLHSSLPQHCLYFLPEPQGHGSLRPTLRP